MTNTPLIFLGAGASAPFAVPTMKDMVTLFEKELTENGVDEQIELWKDVRSRLVSVYGVGNVDIEHMLTLFSSPNIFPPKLSPSVVYHFGLDTEEQIPIVDAKIAESILKTLKEFIYNSCDVKSYKEIFPIYSKLWQIIAQGNIADFFMQDGLEIFTTNYDRCFEIFYDMARNHFARTRPSKEIILNEGYKRRYYHFDYYGSQSGPRLYKLHGSIRRYITKAGKIRSYDGLLNEGDPIDGDEVVEEWLIWPLTGKYIYQYPYSRLMDRFRKALFTKTVWLFIGFSFRDEGIRLILKDVNDELEDQKRLGRKVQNRKLILLDRSADKKKDLFKQYSMIHFYPFTGEFGEDETFDKLRLDAQEHQLLK